MCKHAHKTVSIYIYKYIHIHADVATTDVEAYMDACLSVCVSVRPSVRPSVYILLGRPRSICFEGLDLKPYIDCTRDLPAK